jgi:AraC family transcriptional regulator of adaptative response / DNA-3-methyladenine glycosylase II
MLLAKPVMLCLSYHPPFNFRQVTGFLKPRAIPGVEFVDGHTYHRSISLGSASGFVALSCLENEPCVRLEIHFPDQDTLPVIADMAKQMFDLDAPVNTIDDHLAKDSFLGPMVAQHPGMRVPGAFNPFELCIRAIIGQQISVKGATTIIGRIAERFGKTLNLKNPWGLKYLFPEPEKLVNADYEGIGLTKARIAAIRQFSAAVLRGQVDFHRPVDPELLRKALVRIKGIGEWTAQYILMRTIKHPDAMPFSDLGLLKAVSPDNKPATEKQLKEMSSPWKPWRAYAAMHLWSSLA